TAEPARVMGVIKADAYGHGMIKVAQALEEQGVGCFGVALLQEALELRESGFQQPVLIFGYTLEDDFPQAVQADLTLSLYTLSQAEALDQCARKAGIKAKAHIKIDTGMGRLGFLPGDEALAQIEKMTKLAHVELEGIYSHLAWADNPGSDYTKKQFTRFEDFVARLRQGGIDFPLRHLANSAGVVAFPELHMDMVRPGISLYGFLPDPDMAAPRPVSLKPAMQVKARLALVKDLPQGSPISYGCTFTTSRKTRIGTVPMGYADGIDRGLSNTGQVLADGQRCPILGRVCMDQFMVDLTNAPQAAMGDEVVLMGTQDGGAISAEEIGASLGTISYEIITRIGARLPKIYVD
ncbi:MAG: alanine racemase, partial [Desulfarculaceae bacterium]